MKHTTYITIETDSGDYKIKALLNNDGSYSMPSLEFINSQTKEEEYWDNPEYLLNTLLPILKKTYEPLLYDDKREVKYIKKTIPKADRKELKSIIKESIKLKILKYED